MQAFARTGLKQLIFPPINKQWYRFHSTTSTSRSARGSLCALPDYKIARRDLSEMIASGSRFPWIDEFELGRDLKVDAETVIQTLGALMTQDRIERIESVISKRTFNILPVMEYPYDMGNVAAICRSAEGMGFGGVHIIRDPKEKYKQSTRTSAGSDKWLDVQLFDDTRECLTTAKQLGYRVVVTHLRAGSVPIDQVDWSKPTAIVLGNELRGASDVALEMADEAVYIPIDGFVESYNVSVAAAITFWEVRQRRLQALGHLGDLNDEEKHIMKALMFLRNKGMAKQYITHLLNRPPPEWQLHRNKGDWGEKEFDTPEIMHKVVEGRKRCDFWDGERCWGEQLLFPGKKCRFHELHYPGLNSFNKGKLKHRLGTRGIHVDDINAYLRQKMEQIALVGSNNSSES